MFLLKKSYHTPKQGQNCIALSLLKLNSHLLSEKTKYLLIIKGYSQGANVTDYTQVPSCYRYLIVHIDIRVFLSFCVSDASCCLP
uniref:Uncharacterized protein n=1 Tax=Megaselia scalaris TaxID=36166 RepID=T1GR60_MEGSC